MEKRILINSRAGLALASVLALLTHSGNAAPGNPATVLADAPAAYYRFEDATLRTNRNVNTGSLGAAGNATNLNVRAHAGVLAGDPGMAQFFDANARAIIPFNPAFNPPANAPFTMEAWLYPASDQINAGEAPIANRYAYSGANRQGWVIFKRALNDGYAGQPGYEGVGWNFRMYTGVGSGSGLEVTSQLPYEVNKWTHLVVVYDPVTANDAELRMYVNGVLANTGHWENEETPGYAPNTDDHPATEAVNGPSGLGFGSYNNTQPGSNPFFGAVDEFAFYTTKLTEAQILSHYQNGTNAARSTPYETLIQSANPVVYLRFAERHPADSLTLNHGNLRNTAYASNTVEVIQTVPGALAGQTGDYAARYHWRSNGTTRTTIPFRVENNTPEGEPFTLEGWFKPLSDRINPGAAAVANRYVASGNRTGWVLFQRAPNDTYGGRSGFEGVGWNLRLYTGSGSGGQNVTTALPYTIGEWQHLVFTWKPQADTGNGNWSGTLAAYVNGQLAASNENAIYKANTDPTEDGSAPSDLAVGGYNAASNFGNYYEGDVDELAIYNKYALTAEQVLAHYQAGTNSRPATNYQTLVLTAAYEGLSAAGEPVAQRLHPATYLRFQEPAPFPAANSGTLGPVADGAIVQPAAWTSLNNPAGLNFAGQITLEAWIKPGATQGEKARIISHGPPILSSYTAEEVTENGSVLTGGETFLGIEGSNYAVGSSDGTNAYTALFAIPAGDLGSAEWIHLAGTYDGTSWRLYRNGTLAATTAAPFGAVRVDNGDWAIGATGAGFADYFAGSIDEAAIYRTALSAAQIQAHYSGTSGALKLAITRSGASTSITWAAGILQQADVVTGPFSDVANATSPHTPAAGATMKYYRLRQ
jgi:hypothetical protein